ncbi:response regulator transcription factor [Teredinibacter turnerae]|uniref:response regulator transcription factor n=1 Tax=Teredinibacter turnerae TaxID=2426 RepID=UPI000409E954|nr:response regulator transcription factor [Teredinibacter turnerae]
MADAPHNILIVEDDPLLNQHLSELVAGAGYGVERCFDGASALKAVRCGRHHLMILDLMLPQLDGIALLGHVRKTSLLPVIIVSAKGAEEERIVGLKQGADDYISKPFNATELLLRMEALLRRTQAASTPLTCQISVDSLHLNPSTLEAFIDGRQLELTQIQFTILWQLVSNRGQVLSKAYLYRHALNRSPGTYDRGLDMHLSRVRRKLTDAGWSGHRLQTVHGKGYCLT